MKVVRYVFILCHWWES